MLSVYSCCTKQNCSGYGNEHLINCVIDMPGNDNRLYKGRSMGRRQRIARSLKRRVNDRKQRLIVNDFYGRVVGNDR